jgi:hypothetical protein
VKSLGGIISAMAKHLRKCGRARLISFLVWIIIALFLGPGVSAARATPLFKCIPPEKTSKFSGSLWNSFLSEGDRSTPVKVKDKNGKLVDIGFYGSIHAAPDGEFIILCYSDLTSPAFAKDYLQEKLKTLRISDRRPRMNEKGESIGERIVGFLDAPNDPNKQSPNDAHTSFVVVIRTNGTNYSEICCRSLVDALAFEKLVEETNSAHGRG